MSLGGISAALTGVALVLVVAAILPIASLRRLDAKAPAAAIAALRAYHLFAALPPPVLEGLARELVPIDSHAGDQVIVQGDAGDRFYLIVSGEYDVTIDGRFVRTRGAGEGFGEIALLRDVPRTASVTTKADGVLYGLAREPFPGNSGVRT